MKIKTSELSGTALDWAVMSVIYPGIDTGQFWFDFVKANPHSTRWDLAGPIIEENDISIECFTYPYDATRGPDRYMAWRCGERHCLGPSPLVAAMRCYCQSKLGYEVEVPEELVSRKEQG
jgi:hypothetical protein